MLDVLIECEGDTKVTALKLGLSKPTMYRYMEQLGIAPSAVRRQVKLTMMKSLNMAKVRRIQRSVDTTIPVLQELSESLSAAFDSEDEEVK